MMDFELRVMADCPNNGPATELFRRALDAEGFETGDLTVRELASEQDARELGFHGSPTFVVEGTDLFPSEAEPALSCRVYPTPTGFAGLPSLDDLRSELRGV